VAKLLFDPYAIETTDLNHKQHENKESRKTLAAIHSWSFRKVWKRKRIYGDIRTATGGYNFFFFFAIAFWL